MNSMLEQIDPRQILILGERSVIKGVVEEKTVLIQGKVDGEVRCDSLLIAKSGRVLGKASANYAELWGEMNGNSKVKKMYFLKGSIMRGIVITKSAGIIPGAVLEGSLVFQGMEDEQDEAQESS